jgi:hypothetical protein
MPANPSLSCNGTYSSRFSHQACNNEEPNATYHVGNIHHGKCGNARCSTIQQHHIERALEVSVNKVDGCAPTNNRTPMDVHKMITSLPSSYTRPVNRAKSLHSTWMTLNKKHAAINVANGGFPMSRWTKTSQVLAPVAKQTFNSLKINLDHTADDLVNATLHLKHALKQITELQKTVELLKVNSSYQDGFKVNAID